MAREKRGTRWENEWMTVMITLEGAYKCAVVQELHTNLFLNGET